MHASSSSISCVLQPCIHLPPPPPPRHHSCILLLNLTVIVAVHASSSSISSVLPPCIHPLCRHHACTKPAPRSLHSLYNFDTTKRPLNTYTHTFPAIILSPSESLRNHRRSKGSDFNNESSSHENERELYVGCSCALDFVTFQQSVKMNLAKTFSFVILGAMVFSRVGERITVVSWRL